MKRSLCAALLAAVAVAPVPSTRADEQEAKAVLDKAIKALGLRGELGVEVWRLDQP